jgi:hypothetical protein
MLRQSQGCGQILCINTTKQEKGINFCWKSERFSEMREINSESTLSESKGADNSLAFHIFVFPIGSTNKMFFLGWVKEVRTTKS